MTEFTFEQCDLEERACILTGSDSLSCSDSWTEWCRDGTAVAFECKKCRNVLINPSPSDESLSQFYSTYSKHRLVKSKKNQDRQRQYINDSQFCLQYCTSGRLLDIGCSTGDFLAAFPESFNKYGTDLDPSALAHAREMFNEMSFFELDLEHVDSQGFDLITMRGVIEHVRRPDLYVKYVERNLKKGGLFYVCATPNVESIVAQIYKEKWRLWHPIEHITAFGKTGLDMLCAEHGLTPKAFSFDYLNTPYADYSRDSEQLLAAFNRIKRQEPVTEMSPPYFDAMLVCIYEKQ